MKILITILSFSILTTTLGAADQFSAHLDPLPIPLSVFEDARAGTKKTKLSPNLTSYIVTPKVTHDIWVDQNKNVMTSTVSVKREGPIHRPEYRGCRQSFDGRRTTGNRSERAPFGVMAPPEPSCWASRCGDYDRRSSLSTLPSYVHQSLPSSHKAKAHRDHRRRQLEIKPVTKAPNRQATS